MATKKPTKRLKPASRRRPRAKALRANENHVRTARAPQPDGSAVYGLMMGPMARVMAAYAEFPGRLLVCTSPMQFWSEYLRFGQRLFGVFQPPSTVGAAQKRQITRRPEELRAKSIPRNSH
jgi:hypothetical protein